MRVMIVDADVPYPANSGKRLRSLNLALPLARRHDITYVARLRDAEEGHSAERFLKAHGIKPVLVHEPLPSRTGPALLLGLAGNLVSALPYSVASHRSPGMQAAVAEAARSFRPEVINVEYLGYLYCLDGLDVPVVLQAHNIEAALLKRLSDTAGNPIKRMFFAEQYRKYLAAERQAFHAVDRVVACSEVDAELARDLYQSTNVSVVDNGVDPAYFADVGRADGSRSVLFVGALDWRPNIDAVDQLLGSVLPMLRAKVPDAELVIVGRKPSDAMRARISATAGATLHADVPDVRPFMRASAALAVPLRIGGGSRLKILEALAARLPIVSSTIGAEGLEVADGRDLVIADGPEAMAAALADAIQSPAPARARAERGWATVESRYAWTNLAAKLEQVWLEAARGERKLAS